MKKILPGKLTHAQKGWLGALAAEILIIFLLSFIVLPSYKTEKELSIRFIEENFDFDDLKKDKKIEIPEIDEYIRKARMHSRASNEWLEKNMEGEETETEPDETETDENETAPPAYEQIRQNQPGYRFSPEKKKKKPVPEDLKNFKGAANIQFYLPGRYKTHMINPIYTCPDYMHGTVTVNIEVDPQGKVVKATFDPSASSVSYDCLVNTAVKYAYKTRFNPSPSAPDKQQGYIRYYF